MAGCCACINHTVSKLTPGNTGLVACSAVVLITSICVGMQQSSMLQKCAMWRHTMVRLTDECVRHPHAKGKESFSTGATLNKSAGTVACSR